VNAGFSFTDGVFESEDRDGTPFGEKRVESRIRSAHERPMAELVNLILADVDAHFLPGPQADDVTILLVRRLP